MVGFHARTPQDLNQGARKIFVDKEPHRLLDGADLLFGDGLRGVSEGGKHVVTDKTVLVRNLLESHPTGELSDDKVYRNTSSLDDWLAESDVLINDDARCDFRHGVLPRGKYTAFWPDPPGLKFVHRFTWTPLVRCHELSRAPGENGPWREAGEGGSRGDIE